MKRRAIIKGLGLLPLGGTFLGTLFSGESVWASPASKAKRTLLRELGVRTFINAAGTYTLTVTSLGKLGGLVSTPILNLPEVAIVGINKAVERPVVIDGNITVRRMMNLSSSFDHRFVDGFDAAAMIQALKSRLEHPAALCID